MTVTGSNATETRPSFQPKQILNGQILYRDFWGGNRYARIVPLIKLTRTVRIEPTFIPERPAMAVASLDNIVVRDPVECSGRSKNAISCLRIALNDSNRTLRT
jgi:hypothetical protein